MKQTTVLAPVIDLKRGGSSDERQISDTPPHAAAGLKVSHQCLWRPAFYSLQNSWMVKAIVFLLRRSCSTVLLFDRTKTLLFLKNHLERSSSFFIFQGDAIHICSIVLIFSLGCRAQWFLLWRCTHPVGRRVRSNVPQRLWEGGEATQRRETATEGAGAAEGDWREGKVWPCLLRNSKW